MSTVTWPGVELVAAGTWDALYGTCTVTLGDLAAAVAALECPGVRRPPLKLGHEEPDPDDDGVRWDGEPAVGWVDGMRLSDNGCKLLGDYVGLPEWLGENLDSAYPNCSVEMMRDFRCQIGHVHPVVITAVALLGVGQPAVGVLKSLQDVQAVWARARYGARVAVRAGDRILLADATKAPARRALTTVELASGADFAALQQQRDTSLDSLMEAYAPVRAEQVDALSAQAKATVEDGQLADIAETMPVDSGAATKVLLAAMLVMAAGGVTSMLAEAASQGVDISPDSVVVDEAQLAAHAKATADLLARGLAASASRQTLAVGAPNVTGEQVQAVVRAHLEGLSDATLRKELGGALAMAGNAGRLAVLLAAPGDPTFYASEVNDRSTCTSCQDIDGHRFPTLAEAWNSYYPGRYVECQGGDHCRGQFVAVWPQPSEVKASARLHLVTVHVAQ